MKKIYRLEELDCAHCAAKMENAIRALDGVNAATVNFLAQKLVLDAQDDRFDAILAEAEKIVKKVDSHCRIVK